MYIKLIFSVRNLHILAIVLKIKKNIFPAILYINCGRIFLTRVALDSFFFEGVHNE